MKKIVKLFDYIFIMRPALFYPVWTVFLTGLWGGSRFGTGKQLSENPVIMILIIGGVTLIMGGAYILNQIQDLETDRINGKLFLLADRIISIKSAWIEGCAVIAAGLCAGFIADFRIGIYFFILFIISSIFYSFPPMSFKNRPFLGMLTNAAGAYLVYSVGWSISSFEDSITIQGVPYVLAVMALYINTTLPDIKGDKETGKITIGVKYGIKKAVISALILECATLVTAFYLKDLLIGISALIVLPFFVISSIRRTVTAAVKATKCSVAVLASAVCVVYPWYLAVIAIVFLVTKLYYKKKFNFDYPNFRTE